MTCSPTRSAVRSCSSSGQQRRQLRPQRTKNQPVRREEPPAAAAGGDGADAAGDAGVAGVVADVAAVEVVAAGRSSPDTENRQRTGGRACAPPSPRSPPTD